MTLKEVTERKNLLNDDGKLDYPGWATKNMWYYNTNEVKRRKGKRKEWDRYIVINEKEAIGLYLTFSTIGRHHYFSLSYFDLNKKLYQENYFYRKLNLKKYPLGRLSSDDTIGIGNSKMRMATSRRGERRRLLFGSTPLKLQGELTLHQSPDDQLLVQALNLDSKKGYYLLSEEVVALITSGHIELDDKKIEFNNEETTTIGLWQRGKYNKPISRRAAYLSTIIDNKRVGAVLHDSLKSALFFDKRVYPLDKVNFSNKGVSSKDTVDLKFTKMFDIKGDRQLKHLKESLGYFDGTIIVDGAPIKIEKCIGIIVDFVVD